MADDTADRIAVALAEAKRIAHGLQFACRLPDKVPDFTACGGPAAEAYWDYFTPARISSLLGAIEAALKLAGEWSERVTTATREDRDFTETRHGCADELREAITAALTKEAGDER